MELTVGQVVHSCLPVNEVAFSTLSESVDAISSGEKIQNLDYSLIRDGRFTQEDWYSVLHKDLLNLFSWTVKRIIHSQKSSSAKGFDSAFCFQPYYGITLHYLRRAIPLAILGIDLKVIFCDQVYDEAKDIVNAINDWLSLSNISVLTRHDFELQRIERNVLFVITGKQSTFNVLKRTFDIACCIGATGSGALLIIEEREKLHEQLKIAKLNPSCTNITNTAYLHSGKLQDSSGNKLPNDYLDMINPTVIYSIVEHPGTLQVGNYKHINLTASNDFSGVGLCADPLHGYPGDYLY